MAYKWPSDLDKLEDAQAFLAERYRALVEDGIIDLPRFDSDHNQGSNCSGPVSVAVVRRWLREQARVLKRPQVIVSGGAFMAGNGGYKFDPIKQKSEWVTKTAIVRKFELTIQIPKRKRLLPLAIGHLTLAASHAPFCNEHHLSGFWRFTLLGDDGEALWRSVRRHWTESEICRAALRLPPRVELRRAA